MTMQIRDVVHYDGALWHIWGENGGGIFDPQSCGFATTGAGSTACYCGYHCEYYVIASQLRLRRLGINIDRDSAPLFDGQAPRQTSEKDDNFYHCGDAIYENIDVSIAFSGGLLVGRKVPDGRRATLPAGYAPSLVWRFDLVRELLFTGGQLVRSLDHSETLDELRARAIDAQGSEREQWDSWEFRRARVQACFELDYG